MNPSNLPPQGRYADDRLQQMVLDELAKNGITPEKFYFTSDDWMVTHDGDLPAWNSVFGIATYRRDGRPLYAECGVSQRYDAATSQWGQPAATVKTDLPLSEETYAAAPSALGGGAPPAGASDGSAGAVGAPDMAASSHTVIAGSLPDVPGPGSGPAGAVADVAGAHDEPGSDFPSGEDVAADLRQAGDLGVDESASPGAEAQEREHSAAGHHADVAGYVLRVKEDGTAELQVPLGGQVTLRWAGQQPQ